MIALVKTSLMKPKLSANQIAVKNKMALVVFFTTSEWYTDLVQSVNTVCIIVMTRVTGMTVVTCVTFLQS